MKPEVVAVYRFAVRDRFEGANLNVWKIIRDNRDRGASILRKKGILAELPDVVGISCDGPETDVEEITEKVINDVRDGSLLCITTHGYFLLTMQ